MIRRALDRLLSSLTADPAESGGTPVPNDVGIVTDGYAPPAIRTGEGAFLSLNHLRQEAYLCVPTAAAMVLDFYGEPLSPREIKALTRGQVYQEGEEFSDFTITRYGDLIAGLGRRGYRWREETFLNTAAGFRKGLQRVTASLDARRPVLIDTTLFNGHTVVLCGYDRPGQIVIALDPNLPAPGLRSLPFAILEQVWRDNWTSRDFRPALFTNPKR